MQLFFSFVFNQILPKWHQTSSCLWGSSKCFWTGQKLLLFSVIWQLRTAISHRIITQHLPVVFGLKFVRFVRNFQSLRAKRLSFWLLLQETNPDIIIGRETWLYPGVYEREVLPVGYHIIARRDPVQDRHGGVIIAAKDTITGKIQDTRYKKLYLKSVYIYNNKH